MHVHVYHFKHATCCHVVPVCCCAVARYRCAHVRKRHNILPVLLRVYTSITAYYNLVKVITV